MALLCIPVSELVSFAFSTIPVCPFSWQGLHVVLKLTYMMSVYCCIEFTGEGIRDPIHVYTTACTRSSSTSLGLSRHWRSLPSCLPPPPPPPLHSPPHSHYENAVCHSGRRTELTFHLSFVLSVVPSDCMPRWGGVTTSASSESESVDSVITTAIEELPLLNI